MTAPLRVYPLDPRELTEEQLAVVFAMTSRRPEPFDEIAAEMTARGLRLAYAGLRLEL